MVEEAEQNETEAGADKPADSSAPAVAVKPPPLRYGIRIRNREALSVNNNGQSGDAAPAPIVTRAQLASISSKERRIMKRLVKTGEEHKQGDGYVFPFGDAIYESRDPITGNTKWSNESDNHREFVATMKKLGIFSEQVRITTVVQEDGFTDQYYLHISEADMVRLEALRAQMRKSDSLQRSRITQL